MLCFADRVVLMLNERHTIGGEGLLRSSIVISTFLGLSITDSYLHHVDLKLAVFLICFTFFIVSQHGPLIFLFKMKSSSIL